MYLLYILALWLQKLKYFWQSSRAQHVLTTVFSVLKLKLCLPLRPFPFPYSYVRGTCFSAFWFLQDKADALNPRDLCWCPLAAPTWSCLPWGHTVSCTRGGRLFLFPTLCSILTSEMWGVHWDPLFLWIPAREGCSPSFHQTFSCCDKNTQCEIYPLS